MPHIFFLGATGYLGGSILCAVKEAYPTTTISAIVRSQKDFDSVARLGVKVVPGDHSKLSLIEDCCLRSDIVINAADADDLPLTKAILAGLKRKPGSELGILIHTSGTGVVADRAEGFFTDYARRIWDDSSIKDISSIPATQPHRDVDLAIFEANTARDVSAYIIAPSTVYGTGKGPVNRISQQVPRLIRTAAKRRQAVKIGPGSNVWNNVHIDDLTALYVHVLNLALSGSEEEESFAKFFWGSAAEHTWGDLIQEMANVMARKGHLPSSKVKSLTLNEEPGLSSTAGNSRTIANRGFTLGWIPKMPSIADTLDGDIDATVGSS